MGFIDDSEDFMEKYKKPVTWTVFILLILGVTFIAYKNHWFRSAPKICADMLVAGFPSQVCDSTSGKYECRPACKELSNGAQVCLTILSTGEKVELTNPEIGCTVTRCPGQAPAMKCPVPKTMSPAPSPSVSP